MAHQGTSPPESLERLEAEKPVFSTLPLKTVMCPGGPLNLTPPSLNPRTTGWEGTLEFGLETHPPSQDRSNHSRSC